MDNDSGMPQPQLSHVPDVATLAQATVSLLRQGSDRSEEMRRRLGEIYDIGPSDVSWPRFVNNHAWALVRLQATGTIEKLGRGLYALSSGPAAKHPVDDAQSPPILEDRDARPPRWALVMVSRATWKNATRWGAGPFTQEDLRAVWSRCGGRCELTGLHFRETQIGSGRARRPFAPSLDRIDPEQPYTRDNCRLVLQAVNFALNAWGDEVFVEVTESAVSHRRKSSR